MTRFDFIALVAEQALLVDIPLHRSGVLTGLPLDIGRTLEIVDTLREMGQPRPTAEEVRRWYAPEDNGAITNFGKQSLECLRRLRESDLDSMDAGELVLFATACANWSRVALTEIHARRHPGESRC